MVMFDTNMVLRYLLNDNKDMADEAEDYLTKEKVIVTIEVLAEVIYVLKGVYLLDRDKIADTINGFIELVVLQEKEIVSLAIETYRDKNLDFVDCVLYAYHKLKEIKVATFDKKLIKLMNGS